MTGLAGLLIAVVLIPGLNRLAARIGAVAQVRADRWHVGGPVPRLSGPALYLALLPWLDEAGMLVLGGFCLIGCIDDIRHLPPGVKAVALLIPAGAAAGLTGQPWLAPALWCAANALNLLDHADGIAGAGATVSLAAAGSQAGLAGAGGCLGFLLFNFPPARCFMGDGGSLLLGAAGIWVWAPSGPGPALAWSLLPLTEAVVVCLCRLAAGRRPWVGGTDHSAHALLRRGVPARLLPGLYAAAAAGLGMAGEWLFTG